MDEKYLLSVCGKQYVSDSEDQVDLQTGAAYVLKGSTRYISYKEYDREMSKPFAQPLKKQAWRLFQNNSTGYDIASEIILNEAIFNKIAKGEATGEYKIRYQDGFWTAYS